MKPYQTRVYEDSQNYADSSVAEVRQAYWIRRGFKSYAATYADVLGWDMMADEQGSW